MNKYQQQFHDTYATILGRNYYNQDLRQYVYTPYPKTGKYYSDCSSSACATYQKCGVDVGLLNTAGMHYAGKKVPVKILDGEIMGGFNLLRVGDALLFRGYPYENSDRPLGIGHVEMIYELGKDAESTTICGHGSNKPSLKKMSTYLAQRQSATLSNGKSKGLVEVVRFLPDTDNEEYYSKGEKVKVFNRHKQDGIATIKGEVTVTQNLLIRKQPDYSTRDTWYQTDKGFISAYRVDGWIEYTNIHRWGYVTDGYNWLTSCVKEINGQEYCFDHDGWNISADRLAPDNHIIY